MKTQHLIQPDEASARPEVSQESGAQEEGRAQERGQRSKQQQQRWLVFVKIFGELFLVFCFRLDTLSSINSRTRRTVSRFSLESKTSEQPYINFSVL